MTTSQTEAPWWHDRFIVWLLIAFLAAHVALALLVPDGAARMLVGDRAGDRFRELTELLAAPDLDGLLRVVFREGQPGDWVLFAPAFRLAGPFGVMTQSIVLYAMGLVLFYRLALLLAPKSQARVATVAWAVLPATIFHPHALVSEAICNPLLIAVMLLLVRMELAEERDWGRIILAGTLIGVLAFVRHVYLLVPPAVWLWLMVFRPQGLGARRNAWAVLVLGFALTGLWLATIALGSKRYELGESVGGLDSNLFLRADRMAAMGNLPLPQSYLDRNARAGKELRALLPGEFVAFTAAHPVLFVKTAISDAYNLIGNPGVAMLAGRYLGLFDLGERNHRDLNKWREMREREGPLGVVRLLWQTSPAGFVFNLAGSILWAGFLAFAVIGAVTFSRDQHVTPAIRMLLFGLVAYAVVLTSATAGYTRWDHRSGIEFVLAIWFAIGWARAAAWAAARFAGKSSGSATA